MNKSGMAKVNKREAALQRLREASLETDYESLGSRRTGSPHEFYPLPWSLPPGSCPSSNRGVYQAR